MYFCYVTAYNSQLTLYCYLTVTLDTLVYTGYEKGTCVEEDLVISIIKVQTVILVRNGKESRMRKREKVWPQNASGQPH